MTDHNLVTEAQAIDFLRQHLNSGQVPKPPLGRAFIKQFNIPVAALQGLEIFGYCPINDLYQTEGDAYAIKLIFTEFVQELTRG